MWEYLLDRSLYDHPGATVQVTRTIRRWKDRERLTEGEHVTIILFRAFDGQYGPEPKCLVRNANGCERWVHAANLTGFPEAHRIITPEATI